MKREGVERERKETLILISPPPLASLFVHTPLFTPTSLFTPTPQSWKDSTVGRTKSYQMGCVPLSTYRGTTYRDQSKEGYVLGETTAVYFISEIAPNVCRVYRIQSVDLKAKGLPDPVINYLARTQLDAANRLQEVSLA